MKIRGKLLSAVMAVCLFATSLSVNVLAADPSEGSKVTDIEIESEFPEEVSEEGEEADEAIILSEEEMEALETEESALSEEESEPSEPDDVEAEPASEEEDEDDDPGNGRLAGYIPSEFYGDGIQTFSISLKEVTQPSQYSTGYTIEQGIDVSKWDGSIDWTKVKADGVDFAIIRVAYRGYGKAGTLCTDPYAADNMKGAKKAGVPFGIYIFSQATTTAEAKEEADYAIQVMEKAGYGSDISLPVVMDFEYYSDGGNGSEGRLYDAGLSKSAATKVCNAFCSEVTAKGYTPMVYANKSMLTSKLNASEINGEIWVAQYNTKNTYEGEFSYWQYSSSGKVSGINASVDMNYRYISNDAKTQSAAVTQTSSSASSTSSTKTSSSSSKKTYTKYKTTTAVNYRTGAGTKYKRKGTLAKGKQIQVEDGYSKKSGSYTWKRFKKNGTTYYIASKYIKKVSSSSSTASSSSSKKTYSTYKTTTRVNYRTGAGKSYKRKGTLAKGKKIQVEKGYSKKAGGYTWKRFKMNGKNYYIASKYIKKV